MLRPEYENNLRILIFTIPESEIESWAQTLSWVWDLLVIITHNLFKPYLCEKAQFKSYWLGITRPSIHEVTHQQYKFDYFGEFSALFDFFQSFNGWHYILWKNTQ